VRGVVEETRALSTLGFPKERSGILLSFAAWEAMPDPQRLEPLDRAREDWSNEDLRSLTYVLLPEDGSLTPAELDRRLARFAERVVPDDGDAVSFRARSLSSYFDDLLTAILASLGVITGVQARMLFFVPGLLILAMACFNYINLTVAIAATRAKEVGMSKVLGASARQVIQQHLFEAAAAVVVAFAGAFVLATLLTTLINTAFGFTIGFADAIDGWFWLMTISIVLGTTIIAGAYPAWVMSRFRPLESLRIGAKRSGSGVLRSLFIGSQFAIASVLLTAVLMMYSQNAAMRAELDRLPTDPYVQIENNLIETPDVDPEVLIAALLRSPSIKGATGMAEPVFSATLESDPFAASQVSTSPPVSLRSRFISYDFFSTLGIELLAGRSFVRDRDRAQRADAAQSQSGALGVVIDRDAAAKLGWPNPQDAVGRTIYQQTRTAAGLGTSSALAFEIIGVVDKAPLQGVSGGLSNIYRLDPYNSSLILRLAPDAVPAALAHIEAVWRDLVPDSRLRNVRFLDQTFEIAIFEMNILATALLSIVAFGFLVALAGIFGMALFVANRRRHEIGIRKSLGAGTKQILRQLLVEFGKPVLIGNVIAWPAAYALAQLYVQLYLERAPLTPWPYLLSLAITLAIAWLGFGRQALLASRLQPARVLRYE
jgi:putative ABC transport system permease protein